MLAIEIESDADEGLLGLTTRAERAVIEQTTDPVGVLRIECLEPTETHPLVVVEAAFVERAGSGVVERLEVHLGMPQPGGPKRDKLEALLGDAGGVAFTSLCLRAGERELVDTTLHFGSAIKCRSASTCWRRSAWRVARSPARSACRRAASAFRPRPPRWSKHYCARGSGAWTSSSTPRRCR